MNGITPHGLRHTCAAILIERGAHPKAIQRHLGHSSIQVTLDRYGHLFPDEQDALADGLEAAWNEARAAVARTQSGRMAAFERPA